MAPATTELIEVELKPRRHLMHEGVLYERGQTIAVSGEDAATLIADGMVVDPKNPHGKPREPDAIDKAENELRALTSVNFRGESSG